MRHALRLSAAVLALALSTAPALADERPSAEERTRIEAVLRERGFQSWGEIERENNGREWEVDDARHADGRKYDLHLATDDLRELSRRVDD
jgi:hypothetical protein